MRLTAGRAFSRSDAPSANQPCLGLPRHTARAPSASQLAEQIAFNLLFRCFVGLSVDDPVWRPTVGADKGYDTVAQNTSGRRSRIDARTTRHPGYAISQRCRKRIEEVFGWVKTAAGQTESRFRGTARVGWAFTFATAAYNLIRLPRLLETAS